MRLHRIGDKIIDRDRLVNIISEILHRRTIGATQQEVAVALGLERAFVSHLEGLGEVRRGNRIAVIGFPIANKEELESIAQTFAVDYVYLLSEKERREYVHRRSGAEMFNELLEMLASLKDYDVVIFLASDKRVAHLEKILDREVIGIPLGSSPIRRDRKVKPGILYDVLESITEGKDLSIEADSKRKFRIFKKKPSGKG
ncbi:MAG TPA: transcriptional regulator [Anaerolineae bacterium]|nr:transcriptional regulator [Anaerolineae bacterium]